jgi:type IV pilus assembly protein PilA
MLSVRQRLANDEGFTLIELLVVLIIIGILLSIAVPSYLGFRDKAQKTAAASDVRESIPAVEAFYSDNGTYAGIDTSGAASAALKGYDSGLSANLKLFGSASGYCISEANGTHKAKVVGPGGTVQMDPAVAALCTTAAG